MKEAKSEKVMNSSLFQTNFAPDEFSGRRAKIFDEIGDKAIAVIQGADPPRGAFDLFRQANEFFYLCGVEVPYAYLLLDGRSRKTTLYLPELDPGVERGEGAILNSDDSELVKTLTGVDEVRKPDSLIKDIAGAKTIYTPQRDAREGAAVDPFSRQTRQAHFIAEIQKVCPDAEIIDLSPTIFGMRKAKSPAEIDVMRFSGKLTALAVAEAMRCTRPGAMEYQLNAVADYIYLLNGSRGGSYRAIIGGGENAWHGHYYRNDCELQDGDLVLMDYAPDYGNYTSDIGRMWPINGKYSAWQRELYGLIVEYHKVLMDLIRPGILAEEILKKAAEKMKKVVGKTNFSKPCFEEAARRMLEFRGHLSHTVGLHVHDGGNYYPEPLVPGIVFSVDPQMWIPEEKLYIRVEDTLVVTEDGIENLTDLAPLELDDVEQIMKEEGIIQVLPALEK